MSRYLYIILLILISSCAKNVSRDYSNIDIETINYKNITTEKKVIDEIYDPYLLYVIGGNIVVVNRNRNLPVLYCYDTIALELKNTYGSYGRARNEFLQVDASPKANNDTTLCIYVNHHDCVELNISNNIISEESRISFTSDVENNAIIINDSLTFSVIRDNDSPFKLYNYKTRKLETCFGIFPKSKIHTQSIEDRDNVCNSSSVYNREHNVLFCIYESIPLIAIYDMKTLELKKTINLDGVKEQISSIDKFYEDESIIYLIKPVATSGGVYAVLVNDNGNIIPKGMNIIKFDWYGNVLQGYHFDCFCPIYTITEENVFYGLCYKEDNLYLCRTPL